MIPSHASLNSPPISRTSCERRSRTCSGKRRLLSRATARLPSIARRSNRASPNANGSRGSWIIYLLSRGALGVAVSDSGSGIAPEHLARVFDRFYRAESSRGSDGAGLGLSLVKSIVDLHGGSATIESEIGRGTTVKLTFPPPQK